MVWNIVSDSCCDLRREDIETPSIRFETVPMRIHVGNREFIDNAELNVPEMLAAMTAEKTGSTSACPAPGAFSRAYAGGEKTVCFTISGSLSGSYNAAVTGRELFLEEHPEREVCVIDSKGTAGVMVLLIRKAKELMEGDPTGEHFEEVCAQLRLYQAALRTCFTLENYDNLIKNGRMRPLVGTLLHSLGIHVVAEGTSQGAIRVTGKARGEERTCRALTALMASSKDCSGAQVIICHCENPVGAERLKHQILEDLPVKSVEILPCRGLNSFYAMERGLIVGY